MKYFPIHNRINLLLYTTGFIFLVLLLRLYLATSNQEKLILKESEIQFQNEINALIKNAIKFTNSGFIELGYHCANSIEFEKRKRKGDGSRLY